MAGYCARRYWTQDLVNLIIVGLRTAPSSTGRWFSTSTPPCVGCPAPSTIGFLTLFEWYKNVEVGSYYKAPSYPIWVVCCESHFTCTFAVDGRAAARGKLPTDVYFYDGLANQDAPIKLTLMWDPAVGQFDQ